MLNNLTIREALTHAIGALNAIPNSKVDSPLEGITNTYKLIPFLEKALKEDTTALERIAKTPLWGEPLPTGHLRSEYEESGEYETEDNAFNPSCDTESSYLRDCVEEARKALGLPLMVEV